MKILSKISSCRSLSERNRKGKEFFWTAKLFRKLFSFFLPGPSPWRAVRVTFPLESGCKSSAVKHNFQTFSTLFFRKFLGEIDNRILISDVSHKLFFRFVTARPGPFLGKYRDRRTGTSPVPFGKDCGTFRKVLQYFPKKTAVLSEKDWKRIRNYRHGWPYIRFRRYSRERFPLLFITIAVVIPLQCLLWISHDGHYSLLTIAVVIPLQCLLWISHDGHYSLLTIQLLISLSLDASSKEFSNTCTVIIKHYKSPLLLKNHKSKNFHWTNTNKSVNSLLIFMHKA